MITQKNNLTAPINMASLGKRMITGAGIALILIAIFLIPIQDADPAWGKLWMIRPFIIVPLAGAGGGAFYYFMSPLLRRGGWSAFWANVVSLIVYIIALWLGSVLGLNGTLWN